MGMVRRVRRIADLSQRQLAAAVGVSPSTVGRLMNATKLDGLLTRVAERPLVESTRVEISSTPLASAQLAVSPAASTRSCKVTLGPTK